MAPLSNLSLDMFQTKQSKKTAHKKLYGEHALVNRFSCTCTGSKKEERNDKNAFNALVFSFWVTAAVSN